MKITKSFRIKNHIFNLELEKDQRGKIQIPLFINKPPTAIGELILFVEEKYLLEDLDFLIPESLGDDYFLTCLEHLKKLVNSHIKRFGRILPADLEMYCAEALLIIITIGDKLNNPLNQEAKKTAFKLILTKLSVENNVPIELVL